MITASNETLENIMKTYTGYIRVSDKNKSDGLSQRRAIEAYAERHGLTVGNWVEEFVSASKTNIEDRAINALVAGKANIIVSDITRIGRTRVMELIGFIGSIARYAELHLAYADKVIDCSNVDDAEVIFTVVGQSFASAEEAKRRSERAKAGHSKRQALGLASGRTKGAVIKSKMDEHLAYILGCLKSGETKVSILEGLDKRGCKVSRAAFYKWMSKRELK